MQPHHPTDTHTHTPLSDKLTVAQIPAACLTMYSSIMFCLKPVSHQRMRQDVAHRLVCNVRQCDMGLRKLLSKNKGVVTCKIEIKKNFPAYVGRPSEKNVQSVTMARQRQRK